MTIALLVSLFLGFFTTDNTNQQSNANPTAKIVIVKPIITDDTGV